jgi:tripartite-type tricarboxylate transporter receptor subunit TctC
MFYRYRRSLIGAAVLLATGLPAVVQAQAYPDKPITIIVPFGAGGSADVYGRFLAQRLQKELGQTVVVENRPGAGAVVGTQHVAKAAPDGYTLLLISNTHTVNESLIPNKPYQLMRDFVPVAPINDSDLVLVVKPALAANTTQELVKLARAQPGKLNYASSGTGTPYHMAGELFKSMAGIDIVHVPYKSSGGARTDVMGGQVDMMFDAVTTMTEVIKSGKVRAVATTGKARSSVLPDVPTMAEAGLPDYTAGIWLGVMAPKGTPPAIVDTLNRQIGKIVAQADVKETWTKNGAVPLSMSPEEFGKYIDGDIVKWERIVKISGAKPTE